MKNKYLLTFLIIFYWSNYAFAQASETSEFSINIKFDTNIPLDKIGVYFYERTNNYFEKINYKINTDKRELQLFGKNHYVSGVGYAFPTIVFSYNEKVTDEHSNQEVEIERLFFLVTDYFDTYPKDFDTEIKFTDEKPNILVKRERIKTDFIYETENITDFKWNMLWKIREQFAVSNTKIRISELTN